MPTDPKWETDGYPRGEIWNAIVAACETQGIGGQAAEDVAFHMTDWFYDFEEMRSIFHNHSDLKPGEMAEKLGAILVHVPNHMAAAAKLWTGHPVTDVFGVGAVRETKEEI